MDVIVLQRGLFVIELLNFFNFNILLNVVFQIPSSRQLQVMNGKKKKKEGEILQLIDYNVFLGCLGVLLTLKDFK